MSKQWNGVVVFSSALPPSYKTTGWSIASPPLPSSLVPSSRPFHPKPAIQPTPSCVRPHLLGRRVTGSATSGCPPLLVRLPHPATTNSERSANPILSSRNVQRNRRSSMQKNLQQARTCPTFSSKPRSRTTPITKPTVTVAIIHRPTPFHPGPFRMCRGLVVARQRSPFVGE